MSFLTKIFLIFILLFCVLEIIDNGKYYIDFISFISYIFILVLIYYKNKKFYE